MTSRFRDIAVQSVARKGEKKKKKKAEERKDGRCYMSLVPTERAIINTWSN